MSARQTAPPADPAGLAPMDRAGRMGRLRELMAEAGCEALLVSNLTNVRYLTGFSGSAALLFVHPGGAVFVTDGRYATQAPAELAQSRVPAEVRVLPAVEQPALLAEMAGERPRVGLEAEDVTWARQQRLREEWPAGTALVATVHLVEGLRRLKGPGEMARVATAATTADRALAQVAALLGERPSEVEVAVALDSEMRRLGAEAPAFPTIVASGPNGAEPHHHPGARRLGPGELVVLDFGARVDGYCSDMTRTVRSGGRAMDADLRRIEAVVLASQDAGLSAVRDGVAGAEVDRACREVVEAAGLGEFFVHGTGHGVGLDVHEAPSLSARSQDILCSGQVVTVEPGVYVAGLGGARTEDTVVVTEAGCEVLTLTPK
ncbi:MAG: M24 family metallopeptidase [Acidimicrobiales bacterium]